MVLEWYYVVVPPKVLKCVALMKYVCTTNCARRWTPQLTTCFVMESLPLTHHVFLVVLALQKSHLIYLNC